MVLTDEATGGVVLTDEATGGVVLTDEATRGVVLTDEATGGVVLTDEPGWKKYSYQKDKSLCWPSAEFLFVLI